MLWPTPALYRRASRARALAWSRGPRYAAAVVRASARILPFTVAALTLAACAAGEEGEGYFGTVRRPSADPAALHVNDTGEPSSLDPGIAPDWASSALLFQLFEGLVTYDPRDGHPIQGVAVRYERSADNRVYRFHLRPEARWSDGVPVTAADFAYAWRRALNPATGSRNVSLLYTLKNGERFHRGLVGEDAVGVRAVSDHVLEVELERPAPYFVDLTGAPNLLPVRRDVIEAAARRGEPELWVRPENIVVNGPYTLDRWRFQYEITLVPNPHYWAADTLRIRRASFLLGGDQHAAMNLYKTGELDLLGDNAQLPPEYAARLSGNRDYRSYPYLATLWYELNTRRPPLDDVRVRRALHLAVDRDELCRTVLRGGQPAATHYVPDYAGGGYADRAARDREAGADPFAGERFDPVRARALLAEAGYPIVTEARGLRARGFPPIELLYNVSDEHRQVAVAVQDMWRRHLGISVHLRAEEWRVLLSTVTSGDFQIARVGWVADYDHPHSWLASFRSGDAQNPTGWSDPEFDALLDAAAAASDPAEGIRLYRKAERRALDALPRLPLYFRAKATLVKPWVRGFHAHPRASHPLRWLWIEPEWQARPDDALAATPLELPPPTILETAP